MKKNYKLYKIQPFRNDYKIVNITKKEYDRLKNEYLKEQKND